MSVGDLLGKLLLAFTESLLLDQLPANVRRDLLWKMFVKSDFCQS